MKNIEIVCSKTLLPYITFDGTELRNVHAFKYLGRIITSDGSLVQEITQDPESWSSSSKALVTVVL